MQKQRIGYKDNDLSPLICVDIEKTSSTARSTVTYFLYFAKWNFLALVLKVFLYFFIFQERETPANFSLLQEMGTLKSLLYFGK